MTENVNHPAHYGGADDPYEAIKVIEAWRLGFHLGNAVKYIARAGKKDPAKEREDLEKARWYLDRRIAALGAEKTRSAIRLEVSRPPTPGRTDELAICTRCGQPFEHGELICYAGHDAYHTTCLPAITSVTGMPDGEIPTTLPAKFASKVDPRREP